MWEQHDTFYSTFTKLEFVLNKVGMPFYALELFNAAPDWAKEQMAQCIPELERVEEMQRRFEGHFWVFRKNIEPHIFVDPHDVIIDSFNANEEVFTVRIGVSRMKRLK